MRRFGFSGAGGVSVFILVAGVFLASCSKADSRSESPVEDGGKSLSTESPSVGKGPEGPALVAYRAMWRDLTVVSAAPDPDAPRLRDHAAQGALELMKYGLTRAKKEKVVSKGTPHVNPEVVTATTKEVKLQDCVDGTDWLQYKLNGELKNDVPGSHFKVDARVFRNGTVWKVSYLYMHEAGTC